MQVSSDRSSASLAAYSASTAISRQNTRAPFQRELLKAPADTLNLSHNATLATRLVSLFQHSRVDFVNLHVGFTVRAVHVTYVYRGGDPNGVTTLWNALQAANAIQTGDGNDVLAVIGQKIRAVGYNQITVGNITNIDSGGGNDTIAAQTVGNIHAGDGNDSISATDAYDIDGGSGNDAIAVTHVHRVFGGEGNDAIASFHSYDVDAGAGDDAVSAVDAYSVYGGAGNDAISVQYVAQVDGGTGDDVIAAADTGAVSGGDGNDSIEIRGEVGIVDGGTGNDRITIATGHAVRLAATVGHDTLLKGGEVSAAVTVDLQDAGGNILSTKDLSLAHMQDGSYRVAVKGSDDYLQFHIGLGVGEFDPQEFRIAGRSIADWLSTIQV